MEWGQEIAGLRSKAIQYNSDVYLLVQDLVLHGLRGTPPFSSVLLLLHYSAFARDPNPPYNCSRDRDETLSRL